MIRAWTTCIAALLVLGCQSEEEPGQDVHRGLDPPAVDQPPLELSDVRVDTAEPPTREPLAIGVETIEQEPESEPESELAFESEPEPEPELERDLEAELKAAVGTLRDCVQDFVAASPTTIRISIRATVRPTGRIILPSVHGSGLSEAARKCVERRVGLVVLHPLNDSMSQTVSTIVEVEHQPPVIVEHDPGVPEPRLRNVRKPLPPRPEATSSGRPPLPPRPEAAPSGRPIQEPTSRKVKGPKPRPIDGHDVDEHAKDWR